MIVHQRQWMNPTWFWTLMYFRGRHISRVTVESKRGALHALVLVTFLLGWRRPCFNDALFLNRCVESILDCEGWVPSHTRLVRSYHVRALFKWAICVRIARGWWGLQVFLLFIYLLFIFYSLACLRFVFCFYTFF